MKTCKTCVNIKLCQYWLEQGAGGEGKHNICGPGFPFWRGDCSAVVEAARQAINVGHNDDCMFCGFKDKALLAALDALEVDDV